MNERRVPMLREIGRKKRVGLLRMVKRKIFVYKIGKNLMCAKIRKSSPFVDELVTDDTLTEKNTKCLHRILRSIPRCDRHALRPSHRLFLIQYSLNE